MKYEDLALQKIGEAIQMAVDDRHFSLAKLERESGVSKTILYKIIRGQGYEIRSLVRVMRALQIHMELSLMSEENNIFTQISQKPSKN